MFINNIAYKTNPGSNFNIFKKLDNNYILKMIIIIVK